MPVLFDRNVLVDDLQTTITLETKHNGRNPVTYDQHIVQEVDNHRTTDACKGSFAQHLHQLGPRWNLGGSGDIAKRKGNRLNAVGKEKCTLVECRCTTTEGTRSRKELAEARVELCLPGVIVVRGTSS